MLAFALSPSRLIRIGLASLFVLAAVSLAGRAEPLPADRLKAVKEATVLIRVTLPNGQVVTGSGFFAHAPGLIATNAHVLGMLDPDSRRPTKVEVVIRSGEADARTLKAEVLGVDRGTDLGLIQVAGKDLPAPLPLATANDLGETDEVYAFGFPFGERLGKNITVSKTSVSSLRKTAKGYLEKIQVNGGIHPGNSGGPVTDSKGKVVGVAVSGVKNTQIQFAVPADRLTQYLAGRLTMVSRELPYKEKDSDKVHQPVQAELLDPLGRMQKVSIEFFTGPDGPPRGAGDKSPAPQAGDSPVKEYVLKYDKKTGVAVGEIDLPPLPSPTHRYFFRPVVTDGDGKTRWYGVTGDGPKYVMERVPLSLNFKPPVAGATSEVVSIGSFKIREPSEEEYSTGLNLRARLQEHSGTSARKAFPLRLEPTGFTFNIVRDGKPVQADADLKRIVGDTQFMTMDVLRDEEGMWIRSRADVSKVPALSRVAVQDLSDQVLHSLEVAAVPLPNRDLKPLETWKSRRDVAVGASSIGMTMDGVADYRYTYLGTNVKNGKTVGFVRIEGTIRGKLGEGLDIGGSVSGRGEIDPETGETTYSEITLKADADVTTSRKETFKVMGTLQVQYRRGEATATPGPGPIPPGPMPKGPPPVPSGPTPEPKKTDAVTATAANMGDLQVTKLTIGTGRSAVNLCWAKEAKAFYHVDAAGTVRRISYPDLKEAAALAVGRKCDALALSAAGLVVTVSEAQEAWVLDPETLKVESRIPIAKARRVAATPTSVYGFAFESDFRSTTVTVLDLKAGTTLKTLAPTSIGPGRIGFDHATFSPDGKYLFASGGIEQLFRLKVDGTDLKLDEASPRLIQGAFIRPSIGAGYAAVPSGGGNYGIGENRPGYGTFVFAHDDLKNPVVTLKTGAYPQAVGFDPKAGLFYGQNSTSQLIVFDKTGAKQKEYAIAQRGAAVSEYLVHPEGRKMLEVIDGMVYAIELPKM